MPILKLRPHWTLGENTPKVSNVTISDGKQGNIDTIAIMKKVARERSRHPLIRELALKILLNAKVPSQYYKNESKAIGQFVKDNVRYVRDINQVETLHDPLLMIDQISRGESQGDCDDMATLIASLLLSIGHQPYFRTVKYNDNYFSNYNHVYAVDYEKNRGGDKHRIVLDAIIKHKPIGYEVPHSQGKEFKI